MQEQALKKINKKMKSFINEASGISNKCKKKLIKLVDKHFFVTLPKENFLNIDIEILENGNIKMRDEEYKTISPLKDDNELMTRFSSFEEEVSSLLKDNEIDFDTKKKKSNITNILILFLYLVIAVVLVHDGIHRLLIGDFYGIIHILFIIAYFGVPITGDRLRNRITQAKKYIKSLINK